MMRFIQQASGKFLLNSHSYSRSTALYLYSEHPLDSFSYLPPDLAGLYEMVAAADEGDWLIWFFDSKWPQYSYGAAELEAMPELELMAQLEIGIIFQIKRGL